MNGRNVGRGREGHGPWPGFWPLLLWLLCFPRGVEAGLADIYEFRIAAQTLAGALTQFAELTRIQVVTASSDVGALQSGGFVRRATAAEALAALLDGTPLRFQLVGADTVAIVGDSSRTPPLADGPLIDTVLIIGQGYTRASNTVSQQDSVAQAPGAPVQVYLNTLPGVNLQLSDPYGLYEFGNSVRVRGFGSEQLGISLDGIPLESYDVRDGSPPGRFVDAEDLANASIAQGSGDVTMPSYHALGGSVRYFTREPLGAWSGALSGSTGSNQLMRLYGRLDAPALWDGGPIAELGGSRTRAVQFDNDRASMAVDHLALKLRQNFASGSLGFAYRYGKRADHDMQSYDANGHVADYFDLTESLSGDPEKDALYYDYWTNGRTDQLANLTLRADLGAGLSLDFVPYYEHKRGYGYAGIAPSVAEALYADAVAAVPGREDATAYDGSGITLRRESLRGRRGGATLGFVAQAGTHTVSFGGWFERYRFDQIRPLYNVDDAGRIDDHLPIAVFYDRRFDTRVWQYYVKDSSRWFGDRLKFDAGFKGLYVDRRFEGLSDSGAFDQQARADLQRIDRDGLQPQFGATLGVAAHDELFANYAENFSAAPRNALGAAKYDGGLRPETSRNIDLGLRTLRGPWSGSLSLYHIDYRDRILELTVVDPFLAGEEVYRNVGAIKTYGAELSAYWTPFHGLRIGSALSANSSKFRDNYITYDTADGSGRVVGVKGKTVPDTPALIADLNALYRAGPLEFGGDLKYVGRRYSATTNVESADPYATVDLKLGYELGGLLRGSEQGLRAQFTVYNLFDTRYVGYIAPADIVDNERNGSFYRGAPRALYLSLSADL